MLPQDLIPLALWQEPDAVLVAEGVEGQQCVALAHLLEKKSLLAQQGAQLLEVRGRHDLGQRSGGGAGKNLGREVDA